MEGESEAAAGVTSESVDGVTSQEQMVTSSDAAQQQMDTDAAAGQWHRNILTHSFWFLT